MPGPAFTDVQLNTLSDEERERLLEELLASGGGQPKPPPITLPPTTITARPPPGVPMTQQLSAPPPGQPMTQQLPPRAAAALENYQFDPSDVDQTGRRRTPRGSPEQVGELGPPQSAPPFDAGPVGPPPGAGPAAPPPQPPSEDDLLAMLAEDTGAPDYAQRQAAGEFRPPVPPNPYQEPAPPPQLDPRTTASRVEAPDPDGGRPDVLGHEDETWFDPQAQARKVAELARARGGQQQAGQGQHERDALSQLLSDKDMARVWAMQGLASGPEGQSRAAQIMMQRNAQQQQAVKDARLRDQAQRPADLATREAAAMAGISPESALEMLVGSPIAKNIGNIASLGTRARGQDIGMEKTKLGILSKQSLGEQGQASRERIAEGNQETQLAVADKYAQQKKDARGAAPDPTRILASQLMQLGLEPEQAFEIARNPDADTSQLPAFLRRQIASARIDSDAVSQDPKKAAALAAGNMGKNVGAQVAADKSARDPKTLWKIDEGLAKDAEPFQAAYLSLARLKDSGGLRKIATIGPQGIVGIGRNVVTSEDDQADARAIYAYIGNYAHGLYGASFTKPEQEMVSRSTGIKYGSGIDPAVSPKVLLDFFKTMRTILVNREERAKRYFPGMER